MKAVHCSGLSLIVTFVAKEILLTESQKSYEIGSSSVTFATERSWETYQKEEEWKSSGITPVESYKNCSWSILTVRKKRKSIDRISKDTWIRYIIIFTFVINQENNDELSIIAGSISYPQLENLKV